MILTRSAKIDIKPLLQFSFRLTVRKPANWDLFTADEVFENETLWTGIRFHGALVGLKIRSVGAVSRPLLHVDIYAKEKLPEKEVESLRVTLADCLGAGQDLKQSYKFAEEDSILKHVVEDLYGMHDTQAVSLFNSVILVICLQMARLSRSLQMMDAINRRYGYAIEFDGRKILIQPAAERIAKLDPKVFAKDATSDTGPST